MTARTGLAELKLKTARERCLAIRHTTRHFSSRTESSPATRMVVDFIARCALRIETYLDSLTDLDVLTEDEVERRIHRVTQYVPTLHYLLAVVERSDVVAVPPELASPLRRLMHTIYQNDAAELIVTSSTDLNYSVLELSQVDLKQALDELNLQPGDFDGMPETLFVATLPSVEYDQALQHCIFAHELSHPLWQRADIATKLGPFKVNRPKIAEIIQTLKAQAAQLDASQTTLPLETIGLVARVPDRVQRATLNWCKELASDLFGLLLFGPGFLFSLIHFLCSFVRLDAGSESHPPPRLRLQLLFHLLDQIYPAPSFSATTAKFLESWRQLASETILVDGKNLINELVLWTINASDVPKNLPEIVKKSAVGLDLYTEDRYRADVERLCPLIDLQIPPSQWLNPKTGSYVDADFVGILSAGWESYLLGLVAFRATLPSSKVTNSYDLARQFNGFLLKAFELNEAALSWKAATKVDNK